MDYEGNRTEKLDVKNCKKDGKIDQSLSPITYHNVCATPMSKNRTEYLHDYFQIYYAKNKVEILKRMGEWKKQNPELVKKHRQTYIQNHPNLMKIYYQNNREKYRQYKQIHKKTLAK